MCVDHLEYIVCTAGERPFDRKRESDSASPMLRRREFSYHARTLPRSDLAFSSEDLRTPSMRCSKGLC